MRVPATARWAGLALLGMLIAAGISIAASSLASQQIGLASEPISAGDALAPASRVSEGVSPTTRRHRGSGQKPSTRHPPPPPIRPARPAAPQTTEPVPPAEGDDSGYSGGDD